MIKRNNISRILILLLSVSFVLAQSVPETLKVAALNGPSGVSMAYLFENNPDLGETKCSFENVGTADVLLPKLLKGEIDIGVLPVNVATKVYNKNKGAIVLGAVTGNGMLTIVSKDHSLKTLSDLKGKKLAVAGQGATPEYVFRYLAEKNNISCEGGKNGIELDFSIPTAELATAIASGKVDYALVPEPFATVACTKVKDCIRIIDIQKLWGENPYPMTVAVIRKAYALNYPDTVKDFLQSYKYSVEWTNKNPDKAGQLVEKHTLGLKAAIATKSIPNAALVFMYAVDAKPIVEEFLSVFLKFAPEAIGNKLPDNSFYFSIKK